MNGLSKRLVSLAMATAMVFSLTAVPGTDASAASKYSITKKTSVQANKTYNYSLKGVTKTQYAKVSVSGTAKSGVTVKKGSTTIKSSTKIKGTGKTLTLKVKANTNVIGKKYTLTTKIYNTKTNKKVKTLTVKNVKVNYSATSVKLDQTALTLKTGETATLKATMSPAKTNSSIKTWSTSDANVATVNNGVVTAVGGGEATITVTTSNGKTATAKVTVEGEKKATEFTLTADATKADTITGTLSREVAADATVTVMKDGISTPVDGKATFNGTTVEFKATANFTNGTYTITVKEGELSADAKLTVQDEYVKEIVIKSTQALTNAKDTNTPFGMTGTAATQVPEGTVAYIYYDVLNQYGESLRASTTINWTTSSGEAKVDKTLGRLAVKNGATDPKPFTYGSLVYVTGVYSKTGVSVSQAVPVGLAQSIDSVKAVGFVNKNEPSKLLKELPVNFTKDDYRMLYETYDQDGNALEASTDKLADQGITFISDAPLLIDSKFEADTAATYTIDGTQYSALLINPGKYVDKGGEVNITAISNRTGTKTVTNFVIGKAGMLQSLTISTPNRVVAHGDRWVDLPFVAKDTEGNTVTNYETIVRSSNALTISCTQGTVTVYEKADGTAGMQWSDADADKDTPVFDYDFEDANGIDIPVSITTVVVGGTSENFMLNVQDTRVPVAIKSVTINGSNDAVVAGNLYGGNGLLQWNTVYLDQYGDVLDTTWPVCNDLPGKFFNYAKYTGTATDKKYGQGSQAAYYGVRIDTSKSGSGVSSNVIDIKDLDSVSSFDLKTGNVSSVVSAPVKYSLISSTDGTNWDVAGKITTQSYSVVPTERLGGLSFGTIAKQQLITNMSSKANASGDNTPNDDLRGENNPNLIKIGGNKDERTVKVTGVYNGTWVTVPNTMWNIVASCGFVANTDRALTDYDQTAATASGNSIKYKDLYDFNTAKNTRKDTKRTLKANVMKADGTLAQTIKTDIVLSDAPSSIASVELITDNILASNNKPAVYDGTKLNHYPTIFNFARAFTSVDNVTSDPNYPQVTGDYLAREFGVKKHGTDYILVKDQYGHVMTTDKYDITYKIDNYVENTNEFAHKVNSIIITGSGSKDATLELAELGDKFDLTVTVEGKGDSKAVYGSASTKTAFTVGASSYANLVSGVSVENSSDYKLRKELGLVEAK